MAIAIAVAKCKGLRLLALDENEISDNGIDALKVSAHIFGAPCLAPHAYIMANARNVRPSAWAYVPCPDQALRQH